jgi:hypothetical protein
MSHMPYMVHVWDFLNHFPFPTQHGYRFATRLAGAQGLFAHPVVDSRTILYIKMKQLHEV